MSPRVSTGDSDADPRVRPNASQAAVRTQAARAVRIAFTVLAAILALGTILVVLRSNITEQNTIVRLITEVADAVSGPFSLNDGIFVFTGEDATARNALTNWGIAAIVYLIIGRGLSSAIAPKSSR